MRAVTIQVGHSADPDDAFMVWALEADRVDKRGLDLQPVVSDIQTLNDWALEGRLEVTALSAGAYPEVTDTYVLLPHGASFGEGYGPIVVARERFSLDELRDLEIATPGPLTTATRVLKLALGDGVRTRDLSFDAVLDEVVSGRAAAGLVIHEGQLTYADAGPREAARSRSLVAGRDGAASAARPRRRAPRPRPARRRLAGPARGDRRRPREPRRGDGLRDGLRARHRRCDGRRVRRACTSTT